MAELSRQETLAGGTQLSRWYVRILGAAFTVQGPLGGATLVVGLLARPGQAQP